MEECRRDQDDAVVVHGSRYQARLELVRQFMLQRMEVIDVKQFLIRHESLGALGGAPPYLPELIMAEAKCLGFEHVRVVRVGPHPVWSLTARLGQSVYDCDLMVKVALKRLASNLGFKLKVRDTVAAVRNGCVRTAFCLNVPL